MGTVRSRRIPVSLPRAMRLDSDMSGVHLLREKRRFAQDARVARLLRLGTERVISSSSAQPHSLTLDGSLSTACNVHAAARCSTWSVQRGLRFLVSRSNNTLDVPAPTDYQYGSIASAQGRDWEGRERYSRLGARTPTARDVSASATSRTARCIACLQTVDECVSTRT